MPDRYDAWSNAINPRKPMDTIYEYKLYRSDGYYEITGTAKTPEEAIAKVVADWTTFGHCTEAIIWRLGRDANGRPTTRERIWQSDSLTPG